MSSLQEVKAWEASGSLWNNGGIAPPPYIPEMYGQDFTLLSLGFDSQLPLGCGNFDPALLVAQASSQIRQAFGYLLSNAPKLALMYLLYSQPTIATAMEWLEEHVRKLEQLQLMTCDQAIAMGAAHGQQQMMGDAIAACERDGNTPSDCTTQPLLGNYMTKMSSYDNSVMQDFASSLTGLYQAVAATTCVSGNLTTSGNPSSTCLPSGGGAAGGASLTPASQMPCLKSGSATPCGVQNLIEAAVPDPIVQGMVPQLINQYIVVGAARQTSPVRTESVAIIGNQYAGKFAQMLNALVNATPDQIVDMSSSPLAAFRPYPAIAPTVPQLTSRLRVLMVRDPNAYQSALNILAANMAAAYMDYVNREIHAAALSLLASAPPGAIPNDERTNIADQIASLGTETELYVQGIEAQVKQFQVQSKVYNSTGNGP